MEYCNAVWCSASAGSLKLLEKVQLKVDRAIAHSQRGQLGPEVLSEFTLPALARRMTVHRLCLMHQICNRQSPPSLTELLAATVPARKDIPTTISLVSLSVCIMQSTSISVFSSLLCCLSLEQSFGLFHISESLCFLFQIYRFFLSLFLQSRYVFSLLLFF